jgi:hypothetical protein
MPRSGTTLLETIVGSHSEIAVPPGDFPFAEQHARGLSVDKIFSILRKKETWRLWEEQDFDAFLELPHGDAFSESMQHYAAAMDKRIPATKAPFSEFFFDTYRNWLAGQFAVKFLHMVRDPFDVMASLKKSHIHTNWHVYKDLLRTQAENWRRSTLLGTARQAAHRQSYFVIRYEDLVAEPDAVTANIARFLGVEFEPQRMLGRQDYPYFNTNSSFGNDAPADAGDAAFVYRPSSRKRFLDDDEISVISEICGEAAHALGYSDPDFEAGPPRNPGEVKPLVRMRWKLESVGRRLTGLRSS